MFKGNKVLFILVGLLISVTVFFLVFYVTYTISCAVSPPYFVDDNGEKYGLMPLGQAFNGLIFATLSGIISFVIYYKKSKKQHG